MLLSHHYRFIFIKPRKAAGTSLEISLSRLLEPRDYGFEGQKTPSGPFVYIEPHRLRAA